MFKKKQLALGAAAILGFALLARAQPDHDLHQQHQAAGQSADPRELVRFPEAMRLHTLANMRDHLLAQQQIQEALAAADYDQAAEIAEQRLGMSSLTLHGAHDSAPYMPSGMQDIGAAMHRSASRFAAAAKDAGVTGDVRPALAALARVTEQCVACHSAYRVQ